MAKRCVTSFVRPTRHWPPRAVIPAERTSRSAAGSYRMCGLGTTVQEEDGNVTGTSVAQATTPEKIMAGSAE